jgi:outer membrane immunogenic protein
MKSLVLGSAALAAMIAGSALAAELPVKAPPPPPPIAYYDWSGFYGGFNVGGTWYDVNRHFPVPGGVPVNPDFTTSDSDGIFGFHVGAQWQWGAWVLGAEAALSGCFHECRSFSGTLPVAAGFSGLTFAEHKITNLFTVGPRLGYAWDRWMIFATGGWASADLKGQYCVTATGLCNVTPAGASRNNNGWYAGGGLDYMVYKGPLADLILGVEYQHYDVRGEQAFCFNSGCAPATFQDFDLSAKGDIVRARITLKTQGYGFLWAGPAPAY